MNNNLEKVYSGLVHIDDIYLRGLTSEEVLDKYIEQAREEVHTELLNKGIDISIEDIEIDIYGAVQTEEASDIQYQGYNAFVDKKLLSKKEKRPDTDKKEELEKLGTELSALYLLRERLETTKSLDEIKEILNTVLSRMEKVDENIISYSNDVFDKEIDTLDKEIKETSKLLDESIKAYDESIDTMKKIVEEESKTMEKVGLLSEEEASSVRRRFQKEINEENKKSVEIKKDIDDTRKKLQILRDRKRKITDEFETTFKDNKEVINNESKENVLDNIEGLYRNKDYVIDEKKSKSVTIDNKQYINMKEEAENIPSRIISDKLYNKNYVVPPTPEDMKNVDNKYFDNQNTSPMKEELREKITIYHDTDSNKMYAKKYLFDRFSCEKIGEEIRIKNTSCYEISTDEIDEKIINNKNNASVYDVVIEDINIKTKKEEKNEPKLSDKEYIKELLAYTTANNIVIYDYYKNIAEEYIKGNDIRLDFEKKNPFLTDKDYKILSKSKDNKIANYFARSMDKVVDLQTKNKQETINNETSEIYIDEVKKEDKKQSEIKEEPKKEEIKETIKEKKERPYEVVGLYHSEDNKYYLSKYAIEKFKLDIDLSDENAVLINDKICFEISEDDVAYLREHEIKDLSSIKPNSKEKPYIIDEYDIYESTLNDNEEEQQDDIIIYRDFDNDSLYASLDVLDLFAFKHDGKTIKIEGEQCCKIDEEILKVMKEYLKKSENNKRKITYVDVLVDTKSEQSNYDPEKIIEEIIDVPTTSDKEKFTPENIQVNDDFKKELKEGNWLYNVIYTIPKLIKTTREFISKLTSKLMTTLGIKKGLDEIDRRLDNLNDDELESLKEEYDKTSEEKEILDPIKERIEDKLNTHFKDRQPKEEKKTSVKKEETTEKKKTHNMSEKDITQKILDLDENYASLFIILKQKEKIEIILNSNSLSTKEKEKYNKLLDHKTNQAKDIITKKILKIRKKLSSAENIDITKLPEDAILNFLRIDENNDELKKLDDKLKIAIEKGSANDILDNFIKLDNFYLNDDNKNYITVLKDKLNYLDDKFLNYMIGNSIFVEADSNNYGGDASREVIRILAEHAGSILDEEDFLDVVMDTASDIHMTLTSYVDDIKNNIPKNEDYDLICEALDTVVIHPEYMKYDSKNVLDIEALSKLDKKTLAKLTEEVGSLQYIIDFYAAITDENELGNLFIDSEEKDISMDETTVLKR